MSLKTLEKAILNEARVFVQNHKLRLADLREWSTSEAPVKENATPEEVVFQLPALKVWCCIPRNKDKRPISP